MDARLYNKAKAVVEPFAFDRFRKDKIRQDIDSGRTCCGLRLFMF